MSHISKAIATRADAADRSLEASVDYARKLSASDLLPKSYQGKPQNVLLAVEYGRSIGLDPITAINMTHVVQGKPTASAQLVNALVRRAGHRLQVRGDDQTATWKTYPQAMLKARAITECARDACPEVLAGIQYTAEEAGGPVEVIAEQVTTPELAIEDDGTTVEAEIISAEPDPS